ncbi:MAG: DUF2147 domain-containing protein [Bacteroidales bacterium]|nr:DUF2147 domain-containing protein [Bacteroidales bacterium]
MKTFVLTLMLAAMATLGYAQDITGTWITYDDATQKPASRVEITINNGILRAQIKELLNQPAEVAAQAKCTECKGKLKNQPLIGMYIVDGAKADGKEYQGTIVDPKNGKEYKAKIWLENGVLNVRGYLGPFFRTQVWKRK